MLAEIITIGDEILIGQVVDTNSAFIAEELNRIGIRVGQITAVRDYREQIIEMLDEAVKRVKIIIITGGLGPTSDDITKQTLAEYFNSKLVLHKEVLEHIAELLTARGVAMIDSNRRQAELPDNCEVLHNAAGTAPGMWFEKDGCIIVSLPGVPFEMKAILTDEVLPRIKGRFELPVVYHRTILTCGMGESLLAKKIESWEKKLPSSVKLAYLPSPGCVRLRLSVTGTVRAEVSRLIEEEVEKLRLIVGENIFGYDYDTLEQLTGELLKQKEWRLSVAESCTGGKVSELITTVPGCSAYFAGSVVAYSNESKCVFLGVNPDTISLYGAVSKQVAEEMAIGVRNRFGADVSIATTGIAGPSGGTKDKPVGITWIAISTATSTTSRKFGFGEHRGRNMQKAAIAALFMLRRELLGLT